MNLGKYKLEQLHPEKGRKSKYNRQSKAASQNSTPKMQAEADGKTAS